MEKSSSLIFNFRQGQFLVHSVPVLSHGKQGFPRVWMKCLEIARLQDFAPNTQGLLGALSGAKTPCRIERTPLWNFCLRAWAKVASCCKNFHFNFLCNPDRFSRSHKRTTSVPAAESCTPWFRINKRKPCLTERHFYMSVFDGYGIASSVRPSVRVL